MAVGVIIVVITTSLHLRVMYRNINDLFSRNSNEIKLLKEDIELWETAADSISLNSKDADVVKEILSKKIDEMKNRLVEKSVCGNLPKEKFEVTLRKMQAAYPIKNKSLLLKSGAVLIFVISLFFIESFPSMHRLTLGWSALIGVLLLLIISGKDDMDVVLTKVEWPSLLFFAAMFVLMEAVDRLGFISWIGKISESIILSGSENSRLVIAILIILWVSGIVSAFVDSVPVTTMMVKVVRALAENQNLHLPLQPLVWALAFGPCLGGNGTLFGASANVICAGIAEQHKYRFSFVDFTK